MRAYLIDEISRADMANIREVLEKQACSSGIEGLYWLEIPEALLSDLQRCHHVCRPHVIAVELGQSWLKMEFLVRNITRIQCPCTAYCTPAQRDYIIQYAHHLLETLRVKT